MRRVEVAGDGDAVGFGALLGYSEPGTYAVFSGLRKSTSIVFISECTRVSPLTRP